MSANQAGQLDRQKLCFRRQVTLIVICPLLEFVAEKKFIVERADVKCCESSLI